MVMVIQMNGLPRSKKAWPSNIKTMVEAIPYLTEERTIQLFEGRMYLTGLNLSHVLR